MEMESVGMTLIGAIAAIIGWSALEGAETLFHEMEAFLLFLIAAAFWSGAAIVGAVGKARRHLEDALDDIYDLIAPDIEVAEETSVEEVTP